MTNRTFYDSAESGAEDYYSPQPHSRLAIDRYPDGTYHLHYSCGASGHHYIYRFDEESWEGVVDGLLRQAVGEDVPLNLADVTMLLATICQVPSSADGDED